MSQRSQNRFGVIRREAISASAGRLFLRTLSPWVKLGFYSTKKYVAFSIFFFVGKVQVANMEFFDAIHRATFAFTQWLHLLTQKILSAKFANFNLNFINFQNA